MEELLNKLIEKGWKPRGYECGEDNGKRIHYYKNRMRFYYTERGYKQGDAYPERDYKIRELVSKESGLWQFCCKNRLTNRDGDWSKNAERDEDGVIDRDCLIFSSDYEYWLIESALKDESELEDFLLSNIKTEGY